MTGEYGFGAPRVIIYVLNENRHPPKQGHGSHGLDLCFNLSQPIEIYPHRTYCLPTGARIFVRPQDSAHGDVFLMPRSSASLLTKEVEKVHQNGTLGEFKSYERSALRMANTFALIDWDYRGEIQGRVTVDGTAKVLQPDKAYLQLVPRSPFASFEVVDHINQIPPEWRVETKRGEGGFGSTG